MRHKTLVQDWMTAPPVTVPEDETLIEAYELMRSRNIRRLPVVSNGDELIGVVTRSDIEQVMPLAPHGEGRTEAIYSLAGMTVAEIMASDPVTAAPGDVIQHAAELMLKARVSGLPVAQNGRVVGVITESDIFKLVVESWSEE